ncbi:MAG: HD domain-containing protein [Clostridiales bacterium]|nr:HD domain-containing protein [Clostridiales bacterium]
MFSETEYSVYDFASSISDAVDLVSPDLNDHHKRVAYISYCIAKEMNLPDEEIKDIVLAAMLHDIGAFTTKDRLDLVRVKFNDSQINNHEEFGYKLLRHFRPFENAAGLIKHHHAYYNENANDIPVGGYVIHLADRIAVLLDKSREVLEQVPEMMEAVERHRAIFHPETVSALNRLSKIECFWIEAWLLPANSVLPQKLRFVKQTLSLEAVKNLAKTISQMIDFRSRFTAAHSSGVAAVALELTRISEFSERECRLMEIAGYLHDIGKLAISDDILEKNGALDYTEFNAMRKHTYYTYTILNRIQGFEQIAAWAAYHHERLDGNGYPFHVAGENFTKLARIMAVADIVTAITEDRPYRAGMDSGKAIGVLSGMADNGGIDKGVVEIVKKNFSRINDARIKAQREAQEEFDAFYSPGVETL